jgi:hypothetical protein
MFPRSEAIPGAATVSLFICVASWFIWLVPSGPEAVCTLMADPDFLRIDFNGAVRAISGRDPFKSIFFSVSGLLSLLPRRSSMEPDDMRLRMPVVIRARSDSRLIVLGESMADASESESDSDDDVLSLDILDALARGFGRCNSVEATRGRVTETLAFCVDVLFVNEGVVELMVGVGDFVTDADEVSDFGAAFAVVEGVVVVGGFVPDADDTSDFGATFPEADGAIPVALAVDDVDALNVTDTELAVVPGAVLAVPVDPCAAVRSSPDPLSATIASRKRLCCFGAVLMLGL